MSMSGKLPGYLRLMFETCDAQLRTVPASVDTQQYRLQAAQEAGQRLHTPRRCCMAAGYWRIEVRLSAASSDSWSRFTRESRLGMGR